jgi:signal transduction histidine kinase
MQFFNVQTVFLFYSAISVFCGLLLIGLFWGRKDTSATLWICSCFLSSLASLGSVYRDQVPVWLGYSTLVTLETIALLSLSLSLWCLIPNYNLSKGIRRALFGAACFFVLQEVLRYIGGGQLVPPMALATSSMWVFLHLFGVYSALQISKQFRTKIFFQIIAIVFFCSSLFFAMRVVNMVNGHSYYAFDPSVYNFLLYFSIALLSSFRNLVYVALRMHLGFSEHSRLNNMNLHLTNLLEEREYLLSTLSKYQKSAEVNALASTIAHEVNQPLGALKIDAQFAMYVLNENPINEALLKKTVQSFVANVNRAAEIIKNLIKLSQVLNTEPSKVSLTPLLKEVVEILRFRSQKIGIKVELNLIDDCFVLANPGQLQQVFLNLFNNALNELEHSRPHSGRISLSLHQHEDLARISLQDNGRGIAVGIENTIFELFSSNQEGGSGIGLWLSRDIIVRSGGKIWYEPASGGGANFQIELPLDRPT